MELGGINMEIEIELIRVFHSQTQRKYNASLNIDWSSAVIFELYYHITHGSIRIRLITASERCRIMALTPV